MSEAWEGDNPNPRNRTTLPWLMTAGLALLVGFYAGLTTNQLTSEPTPPVAQSRSLPQPPNLRYPGPMPTLQSVLPDPTSTDAESAAAKGDLSPAATVH